MNSPRCFRNFLLAATLAAAFGGTSFASTLYWQGTSTSGTAIWDTTSLYWSATDTTLPTTAFTSGDAAIFGKFYSYSGATQKNAVVDLNGGTVTASSITFTIPTGTSGITYTLQNGTINLTSNGVSLSKTGARGDKDTITANINLGASTTWDIQTGEVLVSGAITGSGYDLTKTGSGTLTLGGTTTNTIGNLHINDGTVQVNGATAAFAGSNLTIGDGTGSAGSAIWSSNSYRLALTGKNVTIKSDGVFKLGSGGSNTIGELTLAGGYITSFNTSAQILSATKISATADTTQNDSLVSEIRLAGGSSTEFAVNSGVNLAIGNVISQTSAMLKTGDGTLTLSGANTFYSTTTSSTVRAGTVKLMVSSLDLVAGALGGGTNANNTTARTVNLGDASSGSSDVTLLNGASGITTQRQFVVSSSGTGVVTIGGDHTSGTSTFSAYTGLSSLVLNRSARLTSATGGTVNFASAISGSGGITKVGGGTVVLSATNTYAGSTVVSEGTLLINGSTSASSAVNVETGGTLGGTGTVNGATTISGKHAPGASPGIQTFTNGLAYAGTSTLTWELAKNSDTLRGTNFDGVNVTGGNLSIASGSKIDLVFNLAGSEVNWSDSFWAADHSWLVVDYSGAGTSSGVFALGSISVDSIGASLTSVRANASFSTYNDGTDVYLTYTAVPEPGTLQVACLGLACAMVLVVFRRRSRSF